MERQTKQRVAVKQEVIGMGRRGFSGQTMGICIESWLEVHTERANSANTDTKSSSSGYILVLVWCGLVYLIICNATPRSCSWITFQPHLIVASSVPLSENMLLWQKIVPTSKIRRDEMQYLIAQISTVWNLSQTCVVFSCTSALFKVYHQHRPIVTTTYIL